MTKEEREKAIGILKISAPVITVTQKEFEDYIQTLNKIMNWLEQELCDDCVSRHEALSHARKEGTKFEQPYEVIDADVIRALPPVTPQPKVGHWEWVPFGYPSILGNWVCSKCKCVDVEDVRQLPPVKPQYTDTEIQKMQDLEFAEIQKAYEIGKAEGSEALDKIRAEIERIADEEQKHDEKWAIGLRYAVKIIDKYKAETE